MSSTVLVIILLLGCSREQDSEKKPAPQSPAVSQLKEATEGETISVSELVKWQFLGEGEVNIDEIENAVFMTEAEGSKGVTIVSPKSYGESIVLSFKVKPSTYESVNVVIISASDKDTGGDIQVLPDYDGNFGFWTQENVQNYIFAFHNGAHNRKPFIIKNPGMTLLVENDENVAEERWLDIETGRKGLNLWLKIDGKMIVEGTDQDSTGLPDGKVAFRLRGTPDSVASALFKDVVISEE